MKQRLTFILLFLTTLNCHAGWGDVIDFLKEKSVSGLQQSDLNNKEVISGLKQALIKGSEVAVNTLGKENGFFKHPQLKIPMPEKLQFAESALRKLGQDQVADQFILTMNRAAEKAAPKATSIFIDTIKSISIQDAKTILNGSDDAATVYLRKNAGNQMQNAFLPIVSQITGSIGLTEKYKQLIDNLSVMKNFIDIGTLDIDQYVTTKLIDGLFDLIAKEEKLIRTNPAARTTEILKKVFAENQAVLLFQMASREICNRC